MDDTNTMWPWKKELEDRISVDEKFVKEIQQGVRMSEKLSIAVTSVICSHELLKVKSMVLLSTTVQRRRRRESYFTSFSP